MSTSLQANYRKIIKLKRKIATLTGDEYFTNEDVLKMCLRNMIHTGFMDLNKSQLLEFLALCSSHRPMEPHQILTYIAMNVDNWKLERQR